MQILFITLQLIFKVAELLLLLRALLSWFPVSGAFFSLLCDFTEPIILPMRILFDKLSINTMAVPFDLPFLATFLLLSLLEGIVI